MSPRTPGKVSRESREIPADPAREKAVRLLLAGVAPTRAVMPLRAEAREVVAQFADMAEPGSSLANGLPGMLRGWLGELARCARREDKRRDRALRALRALFAVREAVRLGRHDLALSLALAADGLQAYMVPWDGPPEYVIPADKAEAIHRHLKDLDLRADGSDRLGVEGMLPPEGQHARASRVSGQDRARALHGVVDSDTVRDWQAIMDRIAAMPGMGRSRAWAEVGVEANPKRPVNQKTLERHGVINPIPAKRGPQKKLPIDSRS